MRHVMIVICLCISVMSVACGADAVPAHTTPSAIEGVEPQMDGACTTPDSRTTIQGIDAICMLNSTGSLSWQAHTRPAQTPNTAKSDTPQKDGSCDTADARTTIDGIEAICILNSAGMLSWQIQGGESNNQPSGGQAGMAQVGMACDTPGKTAFTRELYVCKNGTWGYPVPGDLPIPSDGSKPAWYPDLDAATHQPASTCTASTITFTHSFLPVDQLAASIPYGSMIDDHVTPIDHAYIGIKSLQKAANDRTDADYLPITAPADGTIIEVGSLGSPTSHRVVINHGCGVYTVYMVVNRLTGVLASVAGQVESQSYMPLHQPIKAGEEFGQQRDNPLDFNVWAGDSWLPGLANPLSYIYAESWKPYTADPSRFFTPELATAFATVMQRTSEPRWGKIDHDIKGSASGTWFLQGTLGYSGRAIADYAAATAPIPGGQLQGKNSYAYGHLSISPHPVDLSKWVFSAGWWNDANGDPHQAFLVIAEGQKTPDKLTSTDGVVVYRLADAGTLDAAGKPWSPASQMAPYPVGYTLALGQAWGSVALQVNTDGSLSVELFPTDPNTTITQLSDQKRTYQR